MGIRFREQMRGSVAFGEADYRGGRERGDPLKVNLTITVDDLERFSSDREHRADVGGWVGCDALGGVLPVETGTFNLFSRGRGATRERRLWYRLLLRDGVGHPITLDGVKVAGQRPGAHVWRDTSTLYVRLLRGHAEPGERPRGELVASGVLHLRWFDFLTELASFRATGPTRRDRLAAIGRFDAAFLGQLWQIYGPGARG